LSFSCHRRQKTKREKPRENGAEELQQRRKERTLFQYQKIRYDDLAEVQYHEASHAEAQRRASRRDGGQG
jgi:hypothetical protein